MSGSLPELIEEVEHLPPGRSFEVGKELFKVASCVGCHKLNDEGRVFGPDLAKLDEKKRTTEHILRSILEPSHEIDEKFQSYSFLLDSGKIITGMVVEETPDELKVVIDPLAKDKPTVIRRDEIEEQKKITRLADATGIVEQTLQGRDSRSDRLRVRSW